MIFNFSKTQLLIVVAVAFAVAWYAQKETKAGKPLFILGAA